MKLSAIALDYDGTIALNGLMDARVREAICEIRSAGTLVILATGRRRDDLQRIAGDLTCFDLVVGENGALLHFPASGQDARLAHDPPRAFLDALTARGVQFFVGRTIVDADASNAPVILSVIRDLELQLSLIFNQDRVMVLPPTIGKSTGLRHALRTLRVSPHNALAIGNAENDHDLLDACEVGVAVAWGSQALCQVADEILPGSDPSAVAPYLRSLVRHSWLSAAQMGGRHINLGRQADGEPLTLTHRGRTLLITGEPGSGKSWLAGLLGEQFILQGYSLCIVDSDGDYRALETLPGVVVLDGEVHKPGAGALARALQHPELSVIVDVSGLTQSGQAEYAEALLPWLADLRRQAGLPHRILLDDAQRLLAGVTNTHLLAPALGGYILVTERAAALDDAFRGPGHTVVLITDRRNKAEATLLAEDGRGNDSRRFTMLPRLTAHARIR